MARPNNKFIKSLVRYGNTSAENLAEIKAWQISTLKEIGKNKGGQLVSGSVNGSSFTQETSMTNHDWVSVLEDVLGHIENGTVPVSRTYARIC